MGVIDPLKVIITNYPEDKTEIVSAINNPEDENAGKREVPFTRELYIERDDFMENPPKKYFRLSPGNEVRLRYAYLIKCEEVIKDADGNILELHCSYDHESAGGSSSDGRKVKGIIHWVSATQGIKAEVRLYDRLFNVEDPSGEKDRDFRDMLNPGSLEIRTNCYLEPFVKGVNTLDAFQFERLGYFNVDKESTAENLVFNRTVSLRDNWTKNMGQ
jgi:glutaminyl-tRNA synthetase